jgi:2'-hydroxyisoflavone reductase
MFVIGRRGFVFGALAVGAAAACAVEHHLDLNEPLVRANKTILILGGTGFLGPYIVDAARAHGHTVTLFNRGKTRPGLFPEVEKLHGDRDRNLDALVGRSWDAVVDTSGFVPRSVRAVAELLAPSVGHYVFISTISLGASEAVVGGGAAGVTTIPDPTRNNVGKDYGALKALCERAAEAAMPGRVANIRPGLIIAPRDPTRGGDVLAPGYGTKPVQSIDVRDLAARVVLAIEQRLVGVYDALGPAKRPTMREVLEACDRGAAGHGNRIWVGF